MLLKKAVILVASVLCLCTSLSAKGFAETTTYSLVDRVSPAYEIADNPYSDLSFDGSKAYCTSKTSGNNVSHITAEQTLQKYWGLWIWFDVDDAKWTESIYASSIAMVNTKGGLESGKYRLKTVFTLTNKNGKTETITVYSDEKNVM